MASWSGVGRNRISRRRKLLLQARQAQRMAARIMDNRNGRSRVPIFARRNCGMPWKNLAAISASRVRSRVSSWGIELPFDHDFVNYVWFDALELHQLRRLRSDDRQIRRHNRNEFPELVAGAHVIGKDILVPAHGIYWPIMLHALGFPTGRCRSCSCTAGGTLPARR